MRYTRAPMSARVPPRATPLRLAVDVLRARQWAHFALLPLAGLDAVTVRTLGGLSRAGLGVLVASASLAYAYGLNAVADRESDVSSDKNPLAGVQRVPGGAHATVVAAAAMALTLGLALGRLPALLTVTSLIASTAYSVGPRMKALPVLGLVFNASIFVPLLGLALPPDAEPSRGFAVLCATFVGVVLQSQLLHEEADLEEDRRASVRTTAAWLGRRASRALVVALVVPFGAWAMRLADRPALGWAALATLSIGAVAALVVHAPARARALHRVLAGATAGLLFLLVVR